MDKKSAVRGKARRDEKKKRARTRWIIAAFLMSFTLTAALSAASDKIVEAMPLFAAALVLICVIALGVVFDIIGLAVATADISVFNSMASRKIKAGKKAVKLINNSERVSSFCNDIVGDIAGVVSGATGAGIAVKAFAEFEPKTAFLLTLSLTSLIAAATVGFKAMGKSVAMKQSTEIVTFVAKLLCGFRK